LVYSSFPGIKEFLVTDDNFTLDIPYAKEFLKKGDFDESYSKEFDILTFYRKGKPCASVEFLTNEQKTRASQGGSLDWAKFDEEPDRDKYKETLMRFGTSERLDLEIDLERQD